MSEKNSVKLASISIDMDEIDHYASIHGLEYSFSKTGSIYGNPLNRIRKMLDELDVRATFFVVGQDLEVPATAEAVRQLAAEGHEIANHSYSHRYELTRMPFSEMTEDIDRGARQIEKITGQLPVGFRAPGYTVTSCLLHHLASSGYSYDSSVFPCPWYYFAKLGVLAFQRLLGRKSASIVGDPRVLLASGNPYQVGGEYWQEGKGLLEVPIGVTPWIRFPYIGTSLTLAGDGFASWLSRRMLKRPFVNLECHGIDWADSKQDGLETLARVQPDLRKPASIKIEILLTAIKKLRSSGYRFACIEACTAHL